MDKDKAIAAIALMALANIALMEKGDENAEQMAQKMQSIARSALDVVEEILSDA